MPKKKGPQPTKGLSIRAYAEHRKALGLLGGSKAGVQKALAAGRIHYIDGDSRKGIDPLAADAMWQSRSSPAKRHQSAATATREAAATRGSSGATPPPPSDSGPAGDLPGGGAPDYHQARAVREAYDAAIRRLEYQEKVGQLIRAEQAAAAARAVASSVRDRLLTLPARLADSLAAEDDPTRIEELVDAELRKALQALSKDPAGVAADAAAVDQDQEGAAA
jgi:hypothetical protein